MKRATLIVPIALALVASTAAANPPDHPHGHVNRCLRAHGWPYGLGALQRAEVRVRHPNGLIRICGGRDAV